MTMNQTEFINQVHAFKEELLNEVIAFYEHGNKERGRIAFARWKQRFREFLKGIVPDEAEHFTQGTVSFQKNFITAQMLMIVEACRI